MSYQSIDKIQQVLADEVFGRTKSSKKAAGRALGTFIEIITFYVLREWGFDCCMAIERPLVEYANPDISHNVEFTLHPSWLIKKLKYKVSQSITPTLILKDINLDSSYTVKKSKNIYTKSINCLKNACILAENNDCLIVGTVGQIQSNSIDICIYRLQKKAFAMFECKRVGVEEGCKKGPQTIEKAKQGAYVAKATSSLQKIRNNSGCVYGIVYEDEKPIIEEYSVLLDTILKHENSLLKNFTLSVGVVSNHGNWFTADNQNKELKVLSQSYDWLLFLSDEGLSRFISDLILSDNSKYCCVRNAFLASYLNDSNKNVFTKVLIDADAHSVLCQYFHENIKDIESWFNVITSQPSIQVLKEQLLMLKNKNWTNIL